MSDSIKVAIKVRPLIKREKDDNLSPQWKVQENTIVSTDTELKKRGDGGYCFDHIFDMDASNADVFDSIVRPIVDAAVNGFNGTIFAYGQTSSGKTYTMMGTRDEPGIIPLAIEHMFSAITNTAGREFLLRVSYLEIYKEKVNDLLNPTGIDLKLKEDTSGQVFLHCKEEITNSPETMISIMKKGDKNRRTGETNMNERSSRSHTIFRITIESREASGDSDSVIQVSQLNLVDLAGSERARHTGATGERFKEGLHINLSLSTLGLVIKQLSEYTDGQKYVNFRDSKLTRLLQNSLGGNAMTTIICAVTPAAVDETQCTLSFACRAKSVKNKPQVNEVMSDGALLKRYAKQISKLQTELQKIKQENRVAEVEEMESKLQEKERANQLLEERIELLKTRIVSGDTASEDSFKIKAKRRQTWGGPGVVNFRPAFQPTPGLPTIKEVSYEKPCRKSIIQSVDLMNETFQTAFTDFELELFESERDRVNEENDSDSDQELLVKKHKHRVTFRDEVFTIKPERLSATPERSNRNTACQTISCQASPSTPKHVLRECISHLTKEFVELRQFTTLEKQLMSLNDNVKKDIESERPVLEYAPEVKKQLGKLNLGEETNTERVIDELCSRLSELEKENILEKETSRKATKQFSEVERQMKNITSERDEFEYMSRELRAELKKKTAELELKNMSEESVKEVELKKIFELERKLKNVTLEYTELRGESTKRIAELQKEVENIVSERKEFELIRRELCSQLSIKSLELDKLKNDPVIVNAEMKFEIQQLEKRNGEIASEKAVMEQTIVDLRAELSRVSSDAESRIVVERTAHEETVGRVSQLQKQVDDLALKGNQLERVNVDLNARLDQNILDFESKIAAEEFARQEAAARNVELEEQLKSLIVEKQQLEASNAELSKTVSEFESAMKSEHVARQETVEKLSVLEQDVESVTLEKNALKEALQLKTTELESRVALHQNLVQTEQTECTSAESERDRVDIGLRAELVEKSSELEAKVAELAESKKSIEKLVELEERVRRITSEKDELLRDNAELRTGQTEVHQLLEKISDLQNQVESRIIEKNELESINTELRSELGQRISKLSAMVASKQIESQNAMERVSELERQLKSTVSEKVEVGRVNDELRQKVSELETKTTEQMEATLEVESKIETLKSEKDELQRIIAEMSEEKSKLEIAMGKLCELETQIEKKELKDANSQLLEKLNTVSTAKPELKNDDILVSEDGNCSVNQSTKDCLDNQSFLSYSKQYNDSTFDTSTLMLSMEKSQLEERLYMKSQELNEIKSDVQSMRQDIENLQETIYLLTTENMEMAGKLTVERENAKQAEANFQKTIDELYDRISDVTNQKITLESNLAAVNDQLESMRSRGATLEAASNEDESFASYKNKIDKLTAENIELSNSIAEKNNELKSIKESKSLLFDHECMYKEKAVTLVERNECLRAENGELSTDLIDKIEEIDELKQQCEIFKKKMEESLLKSEVSTEGDAKDLQSQNSALKAEIIELKIKVTTLSEENTKLSNDRLQTIEDLENSRNEKFDDGVETSCMESLQGENHEAPTLADKVATLQEKVNQLIRLNEKLSDLKLTPCNQCYHLKNLNESRRTLKLEAKSLNQKLKDLQRKFDRKCEDTEILKNKINEEFNTSVNELTANVSFVDEINVSFVEERVRTLNEELQTLKVDHDKLTVLYEDKCSELDQLRSNANIDQSSGLDSTLKKRSEKNSCRVIQIQNHIDQLKTEIDEMKKNSTSFAATLNKFRAEKASLLEKIDGLIASNKELEQKLSTNEIIAAEKMQVLENELTNMSKELEQLFDREKTLQSQRLTSEMELEELKIERDNKSAMIESLRNDLDSITKKNQIDIERLNGELSDIKRSMMKELTSLKCTANCAELSRQSVNEIFLILVQTLVSKEQEMIKTIRETYEKDKQALEEEIQQSADSEKRATTWAKELETEIEKLQTELTERERSQKDCENRISQKEHLLRESIRENEVLRENMRMLEADLHNLQTEFEKLHKVDNKQEEAIYVAQKREKEVQEIFKSKDLEFQSKFKAETEMYEKRINELTRTIESYKTKNLEMSSVVEGLEANEKQLKNIIEANAIEIKKSGHSLERMSAEIQELTNACNEANQQLDQKASHIEEISAILRSKCDTLAEYRAKLDAILPEFEVLKNHVGDQKTTIERYRQEVEMLKAEREEQLEAIKDKLKAEEIKNAGISKQQNNRNVALTEELNELKEKYEMLKQDNIKLERRMRHSTSKIKAEAEMDELKELNKRLQSSLDGASNRVVELQEVKNQTLTQLIDTKAMYDLLVQENTKNKNALAWYETKYNASSSSTHETKIDELLLEKNTIALELEYKKLQLTEKEKEVNEYANQVKQLQEKNKELDTELDEYATIIQENRVEVAELEEKLHSRLTENIRISELEQKLDSLYEENDKLRDQVDALKMRLQMDTERVEGDVKSRQNENVILILKREKADLQTELNTLKKQMEARQYASDTNVSLRDASMMSQDQSRDSSKKVPNNLEGAWNRLTELQGEKYEIMKALTDSRRQCDNLFKENLEVKKILQLYKGQLNEPNLEMKEDEKLDDVLHNENKIAWKLDSRTIELDQKEKNLKECANKMRDLATKNKDLDIELGKSAATIHERDVEISKLKETLKFLKEDNNKLKSEIELLQARPRTNKNFHNEMREYSYRLWNNTSVSNESMKRQLQNSVVEDDEKLKQLKKKIQDLELALVSKNGKLATLELEIKSQSFPYEKKCKDLKEQLIAFSNKNTKLNQEIKELRRCLNDVDTRECDVCRRWRVNRKDQICQTIPTDTIRFCSSNSGVVEDHLKIEKLERDKTMMKIVCRKRTQRVKELEAEINRLKGC
ncbi:uncharacterized protein LOC143207979 [Lasioglossum baleicum]|uniref:uncharacterized protein LOC143207979 n=1 Tax=Lasioglossum baleicum TaxID=434251 RepID=UPI003FCE0B48